MHLVIEDSKKSYPFPANNILLVGNDFDCDVQINHPNILGRHFSISKHRYGNVLEVFEHGVKVNGEIISEKCMLDTGDLIQVGDLPFRLLDDEYIPKDSNLNHTNLVVNKKKNESSVFGLRSFSDDKTGVFIIDDFHHTDGWHVFRKNNQLHFIDNKNKTLLNGMQIAQAILCNGDVISGDCYKFKIELPGSSGFSKFSPSHPRNVLLSESFSQNNSSPSQTVVNKSQGFWKNNLWWLTLLVGLVVLIIVVLNNPQS
jgi:hypothetical protein